MFRKLLKKDQGFTLIEVVIVLAIAALIILIVLLAISGAQRTRRDTTRQSQAGQVAAALEAYASNNNGAYGNASAYISNVNDPLDGSTPQYTTTTPTATAPHIIYQAGYICSGGGMTTAGATARNWAIVYWSEGATATVCRDNK